MIVNSMCRGRPFAVARLSHLAGLSGVRLRRRGRRRSRRRPPLLALSLLLSSLLALLLLLLALLWLLLVALLPLRLRARFLRRKGGLLRSWAAASPAPPSLPLGAAVAEPEEAVSPSGPGSLLPLGCTEAVMAAAAAVTAATAVDGRSQRLRFGCAAGAAAASSALPAAGASAAGEPSASGLSKTPCRLLLAAVRAAAALPFSGPKRVFRACRHTIIVMHAQRRALRQVHENWEGFHEARRWVWVSDQPSQLRGTGATFKVPTFWAAVPSAAG